MNSRTIAIIIFIFGALVLAVVGALIFFQNQDEPQQAEVTPATNELGTPLPTVEGQPPPEEGEPTATPALVEVVVSLQTVPRGHQMTEDILTTDLRKVGDVGSNVITEIDDAAGLFARTDVFQGETITRDTLVRDPTLVGVEEFGPSSLIPPGFVAAAIPVDKLSGVGFSLSEGDYVDIMATLLLFRIDEQFQTFLENDAVFFVEEFYEDVLEESTPAQNIIFVVPFGRVEELPTGEQAVVGPSGFQRPIPITMVVQNAKVIQVGNYVPPESASARIPTATPEPLEEGADTPTPQAAPTATATPPPIDIIVVALSPQQQLFVKHAIEVGAEMDYALRSANDNQLFAVDNVDFQFLLDFFDIEIPPNFDYTIDFLEQSISDLTGNGDATSTPGGSAPEGG